MIGINFLTLFVALKQFKTKMEQVIECYNDWKKIEGFILFLKKPVNWICFIKDNYTKNCAVHRFLFTLEEKIVLAEWEKNR